MSTNWSNSSTNDTIGILRKSTTSTSHHHYQYNQQQQQQQQQNSSSTDNRLSELLVFGYACKIFRDDEKAIYIDQGKHLIPWMGDESHKIDRYDVRATLSDLTQYEPPPGGYINRLDYLTPAEQRAEQLCEEERYYSLYHNEEEEQMYQEEELKRLQQQTSSTSYGQVNFNYDNATGGGNGRQSESSTANEDGNDRSADEPDELYTPPIGLNIPESMETPETMKLHAIIEKTAKFISTQGPQMEILIKAKQSNNPQFEFLNMNNRLNPYYKFVLDLFKNGMYPVQSEVDSGQNDANKVDNQQGGYGGGGINSDNNFAYPAIPIPTIKYKPSANCAYTQLISKIKGVPLPPEQPYPDEPNLSATTPTLITHHAYQVNLRNTATPTASVACVSVPTASATTKNSITEDSEENSKHAKNEKPITKTEEGVEIKKISSGLALAQCYASDTEDESECSETEKQQQQQQNNEEPPNLNFPIPPDYLKHIIDKTAIYVIKNGQQFEEILRTKNDERFTFLNSNDEYHQYYMYKVTGIVNPYPTSNGIVEDDADLNKPKVITPVSFSIKTKEEAPVAIKPALPQETSDDESELNGDNKADTSQSASSTTVTAAVTPTATVTAPITSATTTTTTTNQNSSQQNSLINPVTKAIVPEHVQRAIQLVESQLMSRGAQYAAVAAAANVGVGVSIPPSVPPTAPIIVATNAPLCNAATIANVQESIIQKSRFGVDSTGIIINRVSPPLPPAGAAVTPVTVKIENVHQRELKRAEEKLKDRLAQIAREKLGLISKEKQLQLERKRKAMAFLNQIKTTSSSNTASLVDENSRNTGSCGDTNSDTSSIHSVPVSPRNHDKNDENNDDAGSGSVRNDRISNTPEIIIEDKKSSTKRSNQKEKSKSLEESSTTEVPKVQTLKKKHRSRSRSRSHSKSSKSHKHKKKSKHSKKKSKKKSRSRSRSRHTRSSSSKNKIESVDNHHRHHHHSHSKNSGATGARSSSDSNNSGRTGRQREKERGRSRTQDSHSSHHNRQNRQYDDYHQRHRREHDHEHDNPVDGDHHNHRRRTPYSPSTNSISKHQRRDDDERKRHHHSSPSPSSRKSKVKRRD